MQTFPLYDLLKARSSTNNSPIDISHLSKTVNDISVILSPEESKKHYTNILTLIIHHYAITTNNLIPNPYDGKIMIGGKGILYTWSNLPPLLQRIINEYINFYCEK